MGSAYSFTNQTRNSVNVKPIDEQSTDYRSFNTLDDNGRIAIFEKIMLLNNWSNTDTIIAKTNNDNDGIVQCYTYSNGKLTSIV